MPSIAKKCESDIDTNTVSPLQIHIVEKEFDTVGEIEHTPFGMRQRVTKGVRTGYYYPETKIIYWIPS